MRARLGLDSVTLANEKGSRASTLPFEPAADLPLYRTVIAHFETARKLLASEWNNSFLLTQVSGLLNDFMKLLNTTMIIYKITSTHRSSLATWSFIFKLAFMVKRYIGYLRYGSKTVTAITDENYRRSNLMEAASQKAGAEDQVSCARLTHTCLTLTSESLMQ